MALGLERAIAQILEDAGLGAWADQSITIGEEPPTPADNVTVHLEGGGEAIRTVMEKAQVTVVTRRTTYEDALEDSKSVHLALHEYQGVVRGIRIADVFADTLPLPLGRDLDGDGGRWRQTQTFTATTRRFAFT
jgi:hypothetical protein